MTDEKMIELADKFMDGDDEIIKRHAAAVATFCTQNDISLEDGASIAYLCMRRVLDFYDKTGAFKAIKELYQDLKKSEEKYGKKK